MNLGTSLAFRSSRLFASNNGFDDNNDSGDESIESIMSQESFKQAKEIEGLSGIYNKPPPRLHVSLFPLPLSSHKFIS